jgi:hypothetical protein
MIEDSELIKEINDQTRVINNYDKVLYVVLYVNKCKISVRDSNRQREGRDGKVVILPNGVSVKHGKSEQGNFNRRILDFKHLRYNNQGNDNQSAYPDVIRMSFYKDLSDYELADFRILDRAFNRFIKDYFSERNLDINNERRTDWMNRYPELNSNDFRLRRGDWRQLNLDISNNEGNQIQAIFNELVNALADFLTNNNL